VAGTVKGFCSDWCGTEEKLEGAGLEGEGGLWYCVG